MHSPCLSASLTLLALFAAAPALDAQYGYKDLAFPNTTGSGTRSLSCRVYYPSTKLGQNAPIVQKRGGHPTVVFLHGWTALGRWYPRIGEAFGRAGYVAVMSDTAQFFSNVQYADGQALFPALRTANGGTGFLKGAIDVSRIGIFGHSMGGGNALRILAKNPGYACGLGIAPVSASDVASAIRTPLAILHGEGDLVLTWQRNAQSTYDAAKNFSGVKVFYRFDSSAGHNNIASFNLRTSADREVWGRALALTLGFFGRYLRGDGRALDEVFGSAPTNDKRLKSLQVAVRTPELWTKNDAAIGKSFELGLVGEPGVGALFASSATAKIATSFGTLRLAPSGLVFVTAGVVSSRKTLPLTIAVPSNAALVGQKFWLQGLGQSLEKAPEFGRRLTGAVIEARIGR